MKIDEAIEILERAKRAGTKNIIIAFWEADMFQMNDDNEWAAKANFAMEEMNWENTHYELSELVHPKNP